MSNCCINPQKRIFQCDFDGKMHFHRRNSILKMKHRDNIEYRCECPANRSIRAYKYACRRFNRTLAGTHIGNYSIIRADDRILETNEHRSDRASIKLNFIAIRSKIGVYWVLSVENIPQQVYLDNRNQVKWRCRQCHQTSHPMEIWTFKKVHSFSTWMGKKWVK